MLTDFLRNIRSDCHWPAQAVELSPDTCNSVDDGIRRLDQVFGWFEDCSRPICKLLAWSSSPCGAGGTGCDKRMKRYHWFRQYWWFWNPLENHRREWKTYHQQHLYDIQYVFSLVMKHNSSGHLYHSKQQLTHTFPMGSSVWRVFVYCLDTRLRRLQQMYKHGPWQSQTGSTLYPIQISLRLSYRNLCEWPALNTSIPLIYRNHSIGDERRAYELRWGCECLPHRIQLRCVYRRNIV